MKRIFFVLEVCSFLCSACSDNKEEGVVEGNMQLSMDACNLNYDKPYVIIDIIDGGGEYKVQTSDKTVAIPFIEDEILYVMGFAKGNVTVTVTDQSGNAANVSVTIDTEISRPLPMMETVYVKKGEKKILNAPYDVNHAVAFFEEEYISVYSEDSFLGIEGKEIGSALVYVIKDIWPIQVLDIKIVEIYDLKVKAGEFSVFIGQDVQYTIETGNGAYNIVSSDPQIAEATITPYEGRPFNSMSNPATIKVNPLQEGNVTLTLTDVAGKKMEIELEVKK